jgi:hypothetical protein
MPDVGRVLRGISRPNQDVDTFLNVEPVVSDNTEVGVEYRGDARSSCPPPCSGPRPSAARC